MNVLLVNPEFPDTYWSFRHALSFEGKRSAFPPLALLTIAPLLPAHWNRRLVDMNVRRLKAADIEWADLVFITGMLVQKESLTRVAAEARARGKRVVVGGPYVTTSNEDFTHADHVFIGEAETTLPLFVEELERGEPRRLYRAGERPAMSRAPIPDFKLAELKRYSAMAVQYSRGCPFQCEFCDIIEVYGRVPRTKSPEQMLAELDALRSAGWSGSVFIVDDNFIGNKRNVKQFLPRLTEWQRRNGYPFLFLTEASVNLAEDDEMLAEMRRAGFQRVFLGIETPVQESLKEVRKTQNLKANMLDGIKKIQSYGMEVMGGFIIGFDTDPKDIFERQIAFIRDSAIPLAMVGLLNALPHTQLWRRLKQEGRLLAESTGDNTSASLNFVPKIDSARLIEGYKSVLQTIYSSKEYYQRALDCLKRVSDRQPIHRHRSIRNALLSATRITLKMGILDRERREFWRYIGQAASEHRDKFAEAMRLAAVGYHFRKLVEDLS